MTVGAALGSLAALAVSRYGVSLSPQQAALVGSGAAAVGAGFVHAVVDVGLVQVAKLGLVPALRRAVFGPQKAGPPLSELQAEVDALRAQLK